MSRGVCLLATTLLVSLPAIASYGRSPMADSVDVQINLSNPGVEYESSVFVSPIDPNIILIGNNRTLPGPDGLRVIYWTSQDGGRTWTSNFSIHNGFAGDPAAAISAKQGRFLANFLREVSVGSVKTQWLRYKDSIEW